MPKENKNKKRRLLIFTAVVALIALLAMHWKLQRVKVPPELVGTWRTTNARYADRSFQISLASITFATGPGTESTGFIENIQAFQDHDGTLYTISYSAEGAHEQVSFYYDELNGKKRIQFKNQQGIVWEKDENS